MVDFWFVFFGGVPDQHLWLCQPRIDEPLGFQKIRLGIHGS